MDLKTLVRRMSDPKVTWYVSKPFGGWVRRQAVSTTNPQLLHVADEIIAIPTRFSEYFYWHDGQGNLVSRIFPNHSEAWDHVNETNPNTGSPYDGIFRGVIGYEGYFLLVDLTDGASKSRVYISKRTYPELQVLIFNKGALTIRVNDPPTTHGLSVFTTGARGTGYTDIGQNQYVVFYKSTVPSVDTTNGIFAKSPIGTSKMFANELIQYQSDAGLNIYTGLKAPKDMLCDSGFGLGVTGGVGNRGGINVAGYRGGWALQIYDSDPYCTQRTWAEDNITYVATAGWAEDDLGNVKFIALATLNYKHTTKKEQRGQVLNGVIYDADIDEFFAVRMIKPLADMYSYGQGGAVIHPFTAETFIDPDANVSRAISPTDSILEWTSPSQSSWTYYDAYALMNVYSSDARATCALGIYTDDTGVSIPSDARQAFAVGGVTTQIKRYGLQIKPFMDRTLYAGKTYAVVTRCKIFPTSATGTDLLNWAKKKYPYRISDAEWTSLLNVLPFSITLAGGIPKSGVIDFSVSGNLTPGGTITVNGKVMKANATVYVLLVDPDTYTVIAKNSGTSDANGNFSVSLTAPSNIAVGKKYKLYVLV
jgi:hypothetical protein